MAESELLKLWPTAPGLVACVVIVFYFIRYMNQRDTLFEKYLRDRDDKLAGTSKQISDQLVRSSETLGRAAQTIDRATDKIDEIDRRRNET